MDTNLEHLESLRKSISEGEVPSFDSLSTENLSGIFNGTTLLHEAVKADNLPALKQLLGKGVWFEQVKGKSPLNLAIDKGAAESILSLTGHKAAMKVGENELVAAPRFAGPLKEFKKAIFEGKFNDGQIDFGLIGHLLNAYARKGGHDFEGMIEKLARFKEELKGLNSLRTNEFNRLVIIFHLVGCSTSNNRASDVGGNIVRQYLDFLDTKPKHWPHGLGRSNVINLVADRTFLSVLDLSKFTDDEIARGIISSKYKDINYVFLDDEERAVKVLKAIPSNSMEGIEIPRDYVKSDQINLDLAREMTRVGMHLNMRWIRLYPSRNMDIAQLARTVDAGIKIRMDPEFKMELTLVSFQTPHFEKLLSNDIVYDADSDEFASEFSMALKNSEYVVSPVLRDFYYEGVLEGIRRGYQINLQDLEDVVRDAWPTINIHRYPIIPFAKGLNLLDKPFLNGKTMLMSAAASRNIDRVEDLLKAGANPFIKNEKGKMAMSMTGSPRTDREKRIQVAIIEKIARAMVDNPHLKSAADDTEFDPMANADTNRRKLRA